MAAFAEYDQHDATGLADFVRTKDVHPREMIEAAIEAIEGSNATINAVIHKMYERAIRLADGLLPDGPFTGVPFLLKDLGAAYAGEPLTGGSRYLRYFVPDYDSEVVTRYKQAGLIVVGKTNTPEFGLVAVTEPELHGATRNPWDTNRTPGGSSGGAGAAVAAGYVPAAHGSDGAGSIRIPASACGLFGLKPTRGRVPHGPSVADPGFGLVQHHALTRSVRDSARLLDVVEGPDPGAPYTIPPPERPYSHEVGANPGTLRIGYTTDALFGSTTHTDCILAVESAVGLLTELGHEVEEVSLPFSKDHLPQAFVRIWAASLAGDLQILRSILGEPLSIDKFELTTWILALIGQKLSAAELAADVAFMHHESRRVQTVWRDYDVVVTPTLAKPPVMIGELDPTPAENTMMKVLARAPVRKALDQVLKQVAGGNMDPVPNTMLFNMTGQPAMSVPLFWTDGGLPIGVQFVGRWGDEATLFRLASQLEAARPWWNKRPPALA
ncbi:MAG: amidase [Acidimicrobiia bacterium]|nr:amidase [Acidimicrobiia bacterium]